MKNAFIVTSLLFVFFAMILACKKDNAVGEEEKFFPRVKLIIQDNCTSNCHSPAKGLLKGMPVALDTDDEIVSLAEAIKKSVADSVTIFPRNLRMPEKSVLPDADIIIIKNWFAKGGKATD